jgi:succinate dehydrogenase/fumarate reductase flavoprotein subunit
MIRLNVLSAFTVWYAPWSSGSAYALLIEAGAKMTQMENRIVLARFKDGYGPVGAYFIRLNVLSAFTFAASATIGL